MAQQYLMPMARNTVTQQVVKSQDLSGARLNMRQRAEAELIAERLAEQMSARTREPWVALVRAYIA